MLFTILKHTYNAVKEHTIDASQLTDSNLSTTLECYKDAGALRLKNCQALTSACFAHFLQLQNLHILTLEDAPKMQLGVRHGKTTTTETNQAIEKLFSEHKIIYQVRVGNIRFTKINNTIQRTPLLTSKL